MKEKTALIDKFKGIRNDVDPERFGIGDLSSAVNVDLDGSGKPSRRLGYTRRIAGTPSSLVGFGAHGYYLDGTNLTRFTPPSTALVLRSGLSATRRIAFVEMNTAVFYTNGEVTGKIVQGLNHPWGIAVPTCPTASKIGGNLLDGYYGYTVTYLRRGGQESGARRMQLIQVAANQGLTLSNIPVSTDPDVTQKNLYITGRNGETPFLVGTIPNAQTVFDYRYDLAGSTPVTTMFRAPPPSGHLLTYNKGRIFIAQGSYLWHTDAFAPEQVDFRNGYTPIGEEITILAGIESGIFVGTNSRLLFLAGNSPEQFVLTEIAPYGAPLGNVVYTDGARVVKDGEPKAVVGFMSNRGFIVGHADGSIKNVTQAKYVLPDAKRTATTYKERGGLTQFISVLYT